MQVPTRNAFEMNKLGGMPFPFSISCFNLERDIWLMYLCPQRVRDICDLFHVNEVSQWAVFDVSHVNVCDAKTKRALLLNAVAAYYQIAHHEIDPKFILMSTSGLCQLLQDFEHFDLTAFSICTDVISEDQLIEQYFKLVDRPQGSKRGRLSELGDSNVYLHSHDDCYLHIEAQNLQFLKSIFRRALAIYIGTFLREEKGLNIELPELPWVLIEELWPMDGGLTILRHQTSLVDDELMIGVVPKPFNFHSKERYQPERWIKYNVSDLSCDLISRVNQIG